MSKRRKNYLSELDKRKLAVVKSKDKFLAVNAGAGTGKTKLIAYKISYLIRNKKIPPSAIISIAFSHGDIKRIKQDLYRFIPRKADSINVINFKLFCLNILQNQLVKLGYKKNFNIYSQSDSFAILEEIIGDLRYDKKNHDSKRIYAKLQLAKRNLIFPEWTRFSNDLNFKKSEWHIYQVYQEHLKKRCVIDNGDIFLQLIKLLKKDKNLLRKYQNKFKYLIIDEAQDITKAQFEIIRLLGKDRRSGQICIIGDDDQAILGHEGTCCRFLRDFVKTFPKAKVIHTMNNFRSTQSILNVASGLIRHNTKRVKEGLLTSILKEKGNKTKVVFLDDERSEARYISQQIMNMRKDSDMNLNNIGILLRLKAQSEIIQSFLNSYSIPYKIVGQSFYARQEIQDILSYIKFLRNTSDDLNFAKIINVPPRGIGITTYKQIKEISKAKHTSLWNAIPFSQSTKKISPKNKRFLKDLNILFNEILEKSRMRPREFLKYLLDRIEYKKYLDKVDAEHAAEKWENVKYFIKQIERIDPRNLRELDSFLSNIAVLAPIDELHLKSKDGVNLLTLHEAKGMEFDTVFIPGMEEGILPCINTVNEIDLIEEERKLCYVGITRPKKDLYLTLTQNRVLFNRRNKNKASRFIKELPEAFIEFFDLTKKSLTNMKTTPKKIYSFDVGEKVNHSKWGLGVVKDIKVTKSIYVTVFFPSISLEKIIDAKFLNKVE